MISKNLINLVILVLCFLSFTHANSLIKAKPRLLEKSKAPTTKSKAPKSKAPKKTDKPKKTKKPKKSKKSKKKKKDNQPSSSPSPTIVSFDTSLLNQFDSNCTSNEECGDADFFCARNTTCCRYNSTCRVGAAPRSDASSFPAVSVYSFVVYGLALAVMIASQW